MSGKLAVGGEVTVSVSVVVLILAAELFSYTSTARSIKVFTRSIEEACKYLTYK